MIQIKKKITGFQFLGKYIFLLNIVIKMREMRKRLQPKPEIVKKVEPISRKERDLIKGEKIEKIMRIYKNYIGLKNPSKMNNKRRDSSK